MHLLWNFIGRAAPLANSVLGLQAGDFKIDGHELGFAERSRRNLHRAAGRLISSVTCDGTGLPAF